ncbi:MAG TPA: pyruvate, phosphate dikinase, partial [Longimicrobiales bacterium]|nr:pyruvate, phosphate dikinase [Longimicrobiales bacterium]
VFDSWNNDRAISYRKVHRIPASLGTAVSVVTMVYGNTGQTSGTGVAFTRSPTTGEPRLFGEFLLNAQGEDVVAGIRDPLSIEEMADALPGAFAQLQEVAERLERHYHDMQDLEFTVERGTLYLLQTRTGKRTTAAAARIASDMVDEGLIDEPTAVLRVDPEGVDQLLHPQVDPDTPVTLIARGLPASPGAAAGRVVFDPKVAREWALRGEAVILVREETSPDDFDGMIAAQGILPARGGMTSHAAVVARGIGKCCIVGARGVEVAANGDADRHFRAGDRVVHEGDWITLDGTEGRVLDGQVPTVEPEVSGEFRRIMEWADHHRRLGVRTNADTPRDAAKARENGAEGIGLCRTEHMFFEGERLHAMREMILAHDQAGREHALAKLLPYQRADFLGIFRAMDGLPVTIRLLDPPLHEFLPRSAAEVRRLAERLGLPEAEVRENVARHRESNPMLGHRGVRLATTFPEITEMQTRAIMAAAVEAHRAGVDVRPEIMVPLVGLAGELSRQREVVERVAREVLEEAGADIPFLVGTMIELPRAALCAGDIAAHADFFSFGTNDLTQTALGISRDDAGSFLPFYIETGLMEDDPFAVLDEAGVGQLVEIGTEAGRRARPGLKVGICGEHGGDPRSVAFFHRVGLDYVSCSPYRVPVARLAAAHAALLEAGAESQNDEQAPSTRARAGA